MLICDISGDLIVRFPFFAQAVDHVLLSFASLSPTLDFEQTRIEYFELGQGLFHPRKRFKSSTSCSNPFCLLTSVFQIQ